jgi:UDP-glucose 4-epimerase
MKTAAVFGGGGKLGRRVIAALEEKGFAVRALVHRTPINGRNVTSITGSIVDAQAVADVVRGADVVIQMATTKEDPSTFFDVSIRGTFVVLEACRGKPIRQFMLLGGDAAQGIWFYPQPIPIDENHARTAYPGYYAFSKAMEEAMVEQYAIQYGLPVTNLRSSWILDGTDVLDHFSLLKNVNPAEKGKGFGDVGEDVLRVVRAGEERVPILLDGGGIPLRRHVVHIDDVVQAFELMVDNPSTIGQSFNIAGPSPFEYRVAANYLSRRLGLPTIEIRCPNYHSFEINISRARTVLGYAPQNDFFKIADRALALPRPRNP